MTFAASCKRASVEPFAWFRDVLARVPDHPVTRLAEILPHNRKPVEPSVQAWSRHSPRRYGRPLPPAVLGH
jgi:transposase